VRISIDLHVTSRHAPRGWKRSTSSGLADAYDCLSTHHNLIVEWPRFSGDTPLWSCFLDRTRSVGACPPLVLWFLFQVSWNSGAGQLRLVSAWFCVVWFESFLAFPVAFPKQSPTIFFIRRALRSNFPVGFQSDHKIINSLSCLFQCVPIFCCFACWNVVFRFHFMAFASVQLAAIFCCFESKVRSLSRCRQLFFQFGLFQAFRVWWSRPFEFGLAVLIWQ